MGRIYDARIKKLGDQILSRFQNELTAEFHENKRIVAGKMNTKSKFIINKVTGYVTSRIHKMRRVTEEPATEPTATTEGRELNQEEATAGTNEPADN